MDPLRARVEFREVLIRCSCCSRDQGAKVDAGEHEGRGQRRVQRGHARGQLARERQHHARAAVHRVRSALVALAVLAIVTGVLLLYSSDGCPDAAGVECEGARDDGADGGRDVRERADGAAAPRSDAREVRDGDGARARHGARREGRLRRGRGVCGDAERDARGERGGRAREDGGRGGVLRGARDEAVDGRVCAARRDTQREQRRRARAEDDRVLRVRGTRGGGTRGGGTRAGRRELRRPRVVARHALEQAQHVQPVPAPLLSALCARVVAGHVAVSVVLVRGGGGVRSSAGGRSISQKMGVGMREGKRRQPLQECGFV